MIQPPPRSTLLPYMTLFRSNERDVPARQLQAQKIIEQPRLQPIPFIVQQRSHVETIRRHEHQERRQKPLQRPAHQLQYGAENPDRKSTRLNSSHSSTSYAVL